MTEDSTAPVLMIEEYKSLRREMMQLAASISRWQMVGYIYAACALASAMLSTCWFIAATSLIIIAGCIYGIIHDLTSITRIAAYLEVFHEGKNTGALWETRLDGTRNARISVPMRPCMAPVLSLLWIGMLSALYVVLIPLSFVFDSFYHVPWLVTATRGSFKLIDIIPFLSFGVPIVWGIFWFYVSASYRSLTSGEFKEATKQAFLESRETPGNDVSG